ncbi:DUF4418 family protein [Ruminiclostridium josui]|uniref:DUF4418 family protein n=1 Tax=Ruminiclostridium josui TaxID=1499 RepID=UPI00046522D8|nr:DUF4418 family protein [Ruminiclostridium josui]
MTKLKTRAKVLLVVTSFLGAVTAVLPQGVYHLKETTGMHMGTHMLCYKTCVSVTVLGTILAAIALGTLFVKSKKVNLLASGLLFLGGVLVIIIPKFNGYCEMETMACREITEPTLIVLGVLISLLSIVQILSKIKSIHKKVEIL